MNMIYPPQFLVESSICLLVFYGFYALILKKETFFQLNRYYLLLTPLLSILLPILHWEIDQQQAVDVLDPWVLYMVNTAQELPQNLERPLTGTVTLGDALWLIYLAGLTLMLIRLARAILSLRQMLQQNSYQLQGPAASFFGHILHHSNSEGDDRHLLTAHEQVHARQGHSYDVLFLELLIAAYWFHPLIYGFRRQLRLIHEFIADAAVVSQTGKRYHYACLLVNHSTNQSDHRLLNTFASFTKKRLLMLQQNHSPAYRRLKYLMALPLLIGLGALFSFDLVEELPRPVSQSMNSATQTLNRVAQWPLTPKSLPVHILDEIVIVGYHKETTEPSSPQPTPVLRKRKEGPTLLQDFTAPDTLPQPTPPGNQSVSRVRPAPEKHLYVVDGTPYPKSELTAQDLDPERIERIRVWKGAAAVQKFGPQGQEGVVEIITKSGPVNPEITPPNRFVLEKAPLRIGNPGMSVTGTPDQTDSLIFVIDGEVFFTEEEARLEKLNPKDIAYVNVYRGADAVQRFGDQARVGVIEIFTKKYPRKKAKDKGRSRVSVKIPRKQRVLFDQPDPPITPDNNAPMDFRIFPSPASETIELNFQVADQHRTVTLAIYDAQGKIVRIVVDHTALPPGPHRYQLTKPIDWPKGIYYARLAIDEQIQTKSFVFQ